MFYDMLSPLLPALAYKIMSIQFSALTFTPWGTNINFLRDPASTPAQTMPERRWWLLLTTLILSGMLRMSFDIILSFLLVCCFFNGEYSLTCEEYAVQISNTDMLKTPFTAHRSLRSNRIVEMVYLTSDESPHS